MTCSLELTHELLPEDDFTADAALKVLRTGLDAYLAVRAFFNRVIFRLDDCGATVLHYSSLCTTS